MSQNEDIKNIAIVCGGDSLSDISSFAETSDKYNILHFPDSRQLAECDSIEDIPIVIIDVDQEGNECFEHVNTINNRIQGIRIILIGDFKSTAFPESIPKVFHFLNKPFTQEKLGYIVDDACNRSFDEERRREPRIPIELPVELYFNNKFLKTTTKNLSLHGMQALIKEQDGVDQIAEMYRDGLSPITACRLFLNIDDDDFDETGHLNISVILRYVINHNGGEETLLGFEFRDLDLDLRTRLQDVVIW